MDSKGYCFLISSIFAADLSSAVTSPFSAAARLSAALTVFSSTGVASVRAASIVSVSAVVSSAKIPRNLASADCMAGRTSLAV